MKRVILTFSIFGLLTVQSYSTRSDKVFSAFEEMHYIILYEKGNDFDPNKKLTRKLLIDTEAKRIKSLNNKMQFCANIDIVALPEI